MSDSAAILLLVALPLLAALVVPLLPENLAALPRTITMLVILTVLGLSVTLFLTYDGNAKSGLHDINLPWIASLGVNFHLAVDGFNVYLLLLTAILFPVVLILAWKTDQARNGLFLALLLLLEASLLGTFLSQNLILFFIFWEAVLIPMFIFILVFGGDESRQAALAFFLYTLAGSILLLAAVILLGVESLHQTGACSFEYDTLYRLHLKWGTQLFVFIAIVLACAIKCPLFPFHSWLPLAYFEAPLSGTALMAGALSKMGAFGLLKLALPLCPEVSSVMAPYIILLAVFSILYGAILALRQEDFKRLIAWSSLSHMGYIVLGIFSFQQTSIHGSLFQMLSHGVAVAGLFLMLSLLEQRFGTGYGQLNALSSRSPRLAVLLMLFILTSIALPLTSGFTSEFMILSGAFRQGMAAWQADFGAIILVAAVLATFGMVLGAGYMLRFARTILFGRTSGTTPFHDLNLREAVAFAPLLLLIIWIGVWPRPLINKVQSAVSRLTEQAGPASRPPSLRSAHNLPGKGETNGH